MENAARVGYLARGVLYFIVGALVARLPSTGTDRKVDKKGAFAALADSPFGSWLLGAVAVGLAGFAVYRVWEAIVGADGKPGRRAAWIGSAVVYVGLAALAASVVLGGGGANGNQEKALTARVLGWPSGHLVVGAVGVAVLVIGANNVRKAIKRKFLNDIDEGSVPRGAMPAVRAVGVLGSLGRGLVYGVVGWFVLRAAIERDMTEPVGLDESLRQLAAESWGPAVLWIVFAGLLAFGVLCFATAAWPDPEPDG